MLYSVQIYEAFYTIRVTREPTLDDIFNIDVYLVYYCHKGIVKSFAPILGELKQ